MRAKEELMALAQKARETAYAPYSGFLVGAALEAADGGVFTGGNVENAAYPVGCCAERTALFHAVAQGERRFVQIAIAGGKAGEAAEELCAPCGMCRQALNEFCDAEDFLVHLMQDGEIRTLTLAQLLPEAFGPNNLNKKGGSA